MYCMFFPIVTEVRPIHFSKAQELKSLTLLGIIIVVSEEQFENALDPIYEILEGIVTCATEYASLKALSPIFVTV